MDKMDARLLQSSKASSFCASNSNSELYLSHQRTSQEKYPSMNTSYNSQYEENGPYNIIQKLDDISGKSYLESIYDNFGSLGLLVWYKVRPLEKFNSIQIADELLLELLNCLLKGLKGIKNSQNLLVKLVSVLPSKGVLYNYLQVNNPMEAALVILCICIHKEYTKKYLNRVGLCELDSLLNHLYLNNPATILDQALKLCGFTSLL